MYKKEELVVRLSIETGIEAWVKAMQNGALFKDRLTIEPERKKGLENGFIKVQTTEEDEVISP